MVYQDKTLTCADCGQSFVFSASDQAFHAERGYTNEPKRCPSCRQVRRLERSYKVSSYDRPQREMYPIVCDRCGKQAEVPFRPRGDRPVYCSDCYNQQRQGPATRR